MKNRYLPGLTAAALLLTAAFAQSPVPRSKPAARAVQGGQTPEQAGSDSQPAALLPGYRIGPGDVLNVDVWKEPEASLAGVIVRPDGRLSLPIVGEVAAAGLTPTELQTTLTERYGEVIRDARVSVSVRELNSQRVYIIGEVRRQGPIRITAPLTVLQTLAEAGGLSDFAKRKKIYVLRVRDGKQTKLPFDYDAVLKGEKVEQNITLLPGDTLVVPR